MKNRKFIIGILVISIILIGGWWIWNNQTMKNCNHYKRSMTSKEIEECACPDGYEKFFSLMGAYCATNSQKPCDAHVDCPEDEHCISKNGKDWFCTGEWAGCYNPNPENPEEEICVN